MLSFHGLPLLALGVLQLCIAANLELGSRRYNQPESARSVGPNLFALFKDAVAVRDVNRDPKFKCLTATRIDLDANHSSATYRWSLNIVGVEKVKHPVVHWSSDTIPNILTGIVNSDGSELKRATAISSPAATLLCEKWRRVENTKGFCCRGNHFLNTFCNILPWTCTVCGSALWWRQD
ncbi:uncharacterized protein LOC144097270 isoform X2 [Amblyomma americanum]